MKISKAYFNRFKKAFIDWQRKLGLTQYRVTFVQEKLADNYAEIDIHEMGKIASVSLTTELTGDGIIGDQGPEAHGKHEVLHLLLHRMQWLGGQRYIENNDLCEEWEAIVRRLEKCL